MQALLVCEPLSALKDGLELGWVTEPPAQRKGFDQPNQDFFPTSIQTRPAVDGLWMFMEKISFSKELSCFATCSALSLHKFFLSFAELVLRGCFDAGQHSKNRS